MSRGTLRHALRVLTDEGTLRTMAGRGTFVPAPNGQPPSDPSSGALVAMVLPSIVRSRAPELISGAEEALRDAGYSLLLGTSGDDRDMESEQVQRMVAQGARGLILYAVDGPFDLALFRRLVASGFPIVLIDRFVPDLDVDAVTMDNLRGAYLAVQHLARDRGHTRIGYVGTENLGTSSIVERMAGYRWALSQHNLAYDEGLVCTNVRRLLSWPIQPREEENARHNQEVVRRYLGRPARPTAVYVCNDYVAFQVVEAAESLGLRVPEDLAVVGFDNVAYHEYHGAPLTTVEQPRREIGATAARLLLERLRGERAAPRRTVIPSHLVVRQSTHGPARNPLPGEAVGHRPRPTAAAAR